MGAENGKDVARKAVTERLRRFFAELTAQLAAGTAEIWGRVERRIGHKPPPIDEGDARPLGDPPPPTASREQPMQQQQTKAEDEK